MSGAYDDRRGPTGDAAFRREAEDTHMLSVSVDRQAGGAAVLGSLIYSQLRTLGCIEAAAAVAAELAIPGEGLADIPDGRLAYLVGKGVAAERKEMGLERTRSNAAMGTPETSDWDVLCGSRSRTGRGGDRGSGAGGGQQWESPPFGEHREAAGVAAEGALCAHYHPDGRLAAVGLANGSVLLLDIDKMVSAKPVLDRNHNSPSNLSAVASDAYLEKDTTDGVRLGHVRDEQEVLPHEGGELVVASTELGGMGNKYVSPYPEASNASYCRVFQDHDGPVRCVDFHPTQTLVASGSSDRSIKFFDYSRDSSTHARLLQETHCVNSIAFHPFADFLLSGTDHHQPRLYDLHTFETFTGANPSDHHVGGIRSVAYSASGRYYATAADDGLVKIWDGAASACERTWNLGNGAHTIAFSRNDGFLLSTGRDGSVQLFDIGTGGLVTSYSTISALEDNSFVNDLPLPGACFGFMDSHVLAPEPLEPQLNVWDSVTGRQLAHHPLSADAGPAVLLAANPASPGFLVCTAWDTKLFL